jgi:hypothetical protein
LRTGARRETGLGFDPCCGREHRPGVSTLKIARFYQATINSNRWMQPKLEDCTN